ncbi:MAG: hypothetical protein ACK4S2_10645 [Gemmobacter sp.]|uniref:hypothetical protein n=1 Tax=Gemmobacter sp. TaxID=1898957 RepID=UPI00391CAEF6
MTEPVAPPRPVPPAAAEPAAPPHRPDPTGHLQAKLAPPQVLPPRAPDPPEPTDAARRRVGPAGALDRLL